MCIPFFQAQVTNLQTGQSYCATTPMDFTWVLWVLAGILFVLIFAVATPDEKKQPSASSAIVPYQEPPSSIGVDEKIQFYPGDNIYVTDKRGTRQGVASGYAEIGKKSKR
jgi:hypothetical protein